MLLNSTVSGNAGHSGGGLYLNGDASLTASIVSFNNAMTNGGGIFIASGVTSLITTSIEFNDALGDGGGMLNNSDVLLMDSFVTNNNAGFGGGLFNSFGTTSLSNTPKTSTTNKQVKWCRLLSDRIPFQIFHILHLFQMRLEYH